MKWRIIVAGCALALAAGTACAQEVKVGVVLPYTGIGAELAKQMDQGMELYLKLNADECRERAGHRGCRTLAHQDQEAVHVQGAYVERRLYPYGVRC